MYDPDKSARLAAEAAEALEGVTEGPWEVHESNGTYIYGADKGTAVAKVFMRQDRDRNARFIAWSRQAVPTLAAALQDANAEVVRLREALNAMLCEDCPPVGYPTDKTRCRGCPRRALLPKETPDV